MECNSPKNIESVYELSPTQEGMLLHSLKDHSFKEGIYHQQFIWEFSADLKPDLFRKAWDRVILQNEVLRSAFFWKDLEQPLQAVLSEININILYEDFSSGSDLYQNKKIQKYLEEDLEHPFVLEKPPLMRFKLFKKSDSLFLFIWSHHHIILDGWSIVVVLKQLIEGYTALLKGKTSSLKLTTPPYQTFIDWIKTQDALDAEKFWKSRFYAIEEQKRLRELEHNTSKPIFHAVELELSQNNLAFLQSFSKKVFCSLATLFQAAWGLTLSRFSAQYDVVFGMTTSGRSAPISGIDEMVGLFINTLPVRIQIALNLNLKNWLNSIQSNVVAQSQWEQSSLTDIHTWTGATHGFDLFESILVFENYPTFDAPDDSPVKIKSFKANETTNYPLTLSIEYTKAQSLRIELKYKINLFSQVLIEELLKCFKKILSLLPKNEELCLEELIEKISGVQPKRQSITRKKHFTNSNVTLFDRFVECATHKLSVCALADQYESISYEEMLKRVNLQASNLKQIGLKSNECVVLHMERSTLVVTTIFAIWKIGAHFCFLEPSLPQERKESFLKHLQPTIIIESDELKKEDKLEKIDQIYSIQSTFKEDIEHNNLSFSRASPNDLAYIVLTSGTTGEPKPVMVEHHNLFSIAEGWRKVFALDEIQVHLFQVASMNFDVFLGDIARTFFNGGKMVICPESVRVNPPEFYCYLKNQNISILESTPQLIIPIFEYIYQNKLPLPAMKVALMGSDALSRIDFNRMKAYFPSIRWFNTYGISEATIDTTYFEDFEEAGLKQNDQRLASNFVPIGKAFPNMNFYILDGHLLPLPRGSIGEVYIAGTGVCRGYLDNPAATAQKFIPDPFSIGKRLYKTSDLGRILFSGELEFLGRIDHELKIRGHRVNIREITNLVENWPGVTKSILIPVNNNQAIGCYYNEELAVNQEQLHEYLVKKLPAYMLPCFYKKIKKFPLTSNGKIDVRSLTQINSPKNVLQAEYIDTQNISPLFFEIWEEVLGSSSIGPNKSFFEQGGTSLSLLKLFNLLDKNFPGKASIADLFEHDTIQKQAKFFEKESDQIKSLEEILIDLQKGLISAEEARKQMESSTHE